MQRFHSAGSRKRGAWLAMALIITVAGIFSMHASALTKLSVETGTSATSTNLGLYGGNAWDIAVDGDHVYTIGDGTPNGFFYSSDAAATWQRPAGTNDFGSGQSVEVNATTGDVYTGLGGDLYKSMDHGATLTKLLDNCGNPLVVYGSTILCGWNNTVKVSMDGGTTFSAAITVSTDSLWSLAASKTTGTFYATVYNSNSGVGTLYRSTDTGATWAALAITAESTAVASFTTVRTDPNNANHLAVGNDSRTWISLDAGTTWARIGASRSCNSIATWTSTGKLFACAGYSADNGTTFTDMDYSGVTRGPGKIIVVDPADETIVYGDTMSGVGKSIDGGQTWSNKNRGITAVNALAISVSADKNTAWVSSTQGLAKSTNFQSATPTWTFPVLPCAPQRCDPSGIGESIWVQPYNPNIILAGSVGGYIFRSTDAGITWALASAPSINAAKFKTSEGTNSLRPYAFVNDPNTPSTVYAALAGYPSAGTQIGTVLVSTDSGATWADLGIPGDAAARSIAISYGGELYVGVSSSAATSGIYKYFAGAWTTATGLPTDVDVHSIVVDPDTQTTIYAAISGESTLGHDGFFKSADSGTTWTQVTNGLTSYHGFEAITTQKSTTPNTLYLSGKDSAAHGLLLKSSDGGATWGLLFQGLKSESYNTVLFDGLVAGNTRGLFAMKSKAKVTLKSSTKSVRKGQTVTLTGTLKDSATNKILKSRKVKLYKKVGTRWIYQKQMTTNSKGVVKLTIRPTTTRQFKLVYSPSPRDKNEYTTSQSSILTIKFNR